MNNRKMLVIAAALILCLFVISGLTVNAQSPSVSPLPAQPTPSKQKNVLQLIIETIFGFSESGVDGYTLKQNSVKKDEEIPGSNGLQTSAGSSNTTVAPELIFENPPVQVQTSEYNLGPSDQESVLKYQQELSNEPVRTWAAKCLYYEKYLQKKGVSIRPYLLCGWTWFEGAFSPYVINCKDNGDLNLKQNVGEVCRNRAHRSGDQNTLIQVGGAQGYDNAASDNYRKLFTKCYGAEGSAANAKLREILKSVYNNSGTSPIDRFSYPQQENYDAQYAEGDKPGPGLVKRFKNKISSAQWEDIASSSEELSEDDYKQFITLLLAKDDCIRVGMNAAATYSLPSDIPSKGWAQYVRNQLPDLSSRVQALMEFDKKNYDLFLKNKDSSKTSSSDSTGPNVDTGPVKPAEAGPIPPKEYPNGINCPSQTDAIIFNNSDMQPLQWNQPCIKPKMIVIHWSVGWTPARTVLDVLNERGLACHFATSGTNQLQMLSMYPAVVEREACVAGYGNTISFEITGDTFDNVYKNPQHTRYKVLSDSTNTVVKTVCKLLKTYNLKKTQVYGHLELNPGDKQDPGKEYIKYIRGRINKECL